MGANEYYPVYRKKGSSTFYWWTSYHEHWSNSAASEEALNRHYKVRKDRDNPDFVWSEEQPVKF